MRLGVRHMTRGLGVLALLGLMVLALGCSCPPYPNLVQDYGRSVGNNIAAQVVNPEAGRVAKASVGQTPEAAAHAYDKYNKSFSPEEKKPMFKITTEK